MLYMTLICFDPPGYGVLSVRNKGQDFQTALDQISRKTMFDISSLPKGYHTIPNIPTSKFRQPLVVGVINSVLLFFFNLW